MKNSNVKKPKHSTTIYLQREHNEYIREALKEVARSLSPDGKVSFYVMGLIMKDFAARGLVNNRKEPIVAKLDELKKKNAERPLIKPDGLEDE